MMLRNDEGCQGMLKNRSEESSVFNGLSASTGSRSKSPRVVGWKGETVEALRHIDIDTNADVDVLSPLNSRTSFQSGKMFWKKLLDEKDTPAISPSSESESNYSDYAEIHLTSSSVSSTITDHSSFRGMKSTLSVNIPTSESLHSLSVSSIDKKWNQEVDGRKIDSDLQISSTEMSDHTGDSYKQGVRKNSEDGKKRQSPVAYPFGMMPMKSPRFKTMSESLSSPKASFDFENSDGSTAGPQSTEKRLSNSWAATAQKNRVNMPQKTSQATFDSSEKFKNAYSAWRKAGLMKESRDDSHVSRRESSFPSSQQTKEVSESRDSVSGERLSGNTQPLRNNDVIEYYKAWQRAGLMKRNPRLNSKNKVPTQTQQAKSSNTKPTRTTRRASGLVKKAPDANGNPYRAWQKVGLMKPERGDKENHIGNSTPSSVGNAPDTRVRKSISPGEKSKPMPLPLAPSTTVNVPPAPKQEHVERTVTEESEDQYDEFTNILNSIRHRNSTDENDPPNLGKNSEPLKKFHARKISDGDSVSSNHRRVGGLSIQTASNNGSTVDFFDQMREQLSPRANVQISPRPSGRGTSCFEKDAVYPKSPANSSSIFRASEPRAGGDKGFEATVRAGKERLQSWEEKTPENKNRPRPNHFQKVCESLESSDVMEGALNNLGDNRVIVLLERDSRYEILVGRTNQSSNPQQLVLQNLHVIASETTTETERDGACQCSQSIFSGNDNLIDFFLPQMGMACTCRQQTWICANPDDPTAIENVLRPWQVNFLHRFGITHAEELVKARHRSVGILGKAMRQWRMKEGMQTFRTSSCIMALDIWSKTCKAYVRSVRQQLGTNGGHHGTREMPRTLVPEISKFLMENSPARTPEKSFESVFA